MATMHGLSVIANSCIKPPINPETGLSRTENERTSYNFSRSVNDFTQDSDGESKWQSGTVGNINGINNPANTNGLFNRTDSMIQSLTSELGHLSDEAFYQKLLELKNEHKQTLQMCEALYSEKTGSKPHIYGESNYMHLNGNEHTRYESDKFNNSYNAISKSVPSARDSVRDMSSSKPPIGKRPQSAKPLLVCSGEHARADQSSEDEGYWKPISAVTTDAELSRDDIVDGIRCDYDHSHCHHRNDGHLHNGNDSRHSALSQIEDMWENFSVDEYAPQRGRQRSSSLSRASNSSTKKSKEDAAVYSGIDTSEWRHRITLPKPFQMSLRESQKFKEKSKTLMEYEMKKNAELAKEEEECQKKFKAKPVPAHIYMPLFDEKMDELENKRKIAKETSKELLKSTEKPFSFMKREEERKKYRHQKCATNNKAVADEELQKRPPTGFKARPFPAHIFDGTVMDRLQEEEEYRKIRVQMRAEELLKTASLPPNMAARGKDYTDGKSRQKIYSERARKAGITVEHKFKPKVNDEVPDFEEQHRQLLNEMSWRKKAKEATVCKPFNLRTERVAAKNHKIYEDIARDAEKMRSSSSFARSKSRLLRTRSLSASMDSIPAKMTASAHLRTSANRTKIQRELDAQLEELERERQRQLKEKKLKKYIIERAAANDQSKDLERTLKTKKKEHKEAERARKEEYLRTLNEIEERIQKRPLLFERTLQANAKQAAERKYKDTLRRAGLDEDFIATKGREATAADLSAVSDDEDGGDYAFSARSSAYSNGTRSPISRSQSRSESRRYSEEAWSDGNRTGEGSDIEQD